MGELDVDGMSDDTQTLLAANVRSHCMLQATRSELRVIDLQSLQCISKWSPPDSTSKGRFTENVSF